jgi:hypothetical protein
MSENDPPIDGNPDDLITASDVAEIWNRRAAAMGLQATYTRRSVNLRRKYRGRGSTRGVNVLTPAQETPLGFLYRRGDAWAHPIHPNRKRDEEEPDAGQDKNVA